MSLTLIGDPKQTLYLFRFANPDILERMDKLIPDAQEGHILKNYRAPKQLVLLANYFSDVFNGDLEVHYSDPHKEVETDVLTVNNFDTVVSESRYVSQKIARLRDKGIDLRDIAILSRTNRQLLEFEGGLISEKIPYKIRYDSRSVLNQSSFKVIYSIYSILFNPKDINALCEIIIPIKGIGDKFIESLREKVLYMIRENPNFSVFDDINPRTMGKMTKQFQTLFDFIEKILKPAREMFRKKTVSFPSFNIGLKDLLRNHVQYDDEKNENAVVSLTIPRDMFNRAFSILQNIYTITSEDSDFRSKTDFECFVKIYETLQLSQEAYTGYKNQKVQEGERKSAVTLSTIHGAKGLEWSYVFGVSLRRYTEVNPHAFENKCVFYVLITRAKRKLFLTSSEYIRSFKGDLIRSGENPFIEQYTGGLERLRQELGE